MHESIEKEVQTWFEKVVLGLDLCPFAKKPHKDKIIKYRVSHAASDEELLVDLQDELHFLDKTPASKVETTMLIVANTLESFEDYNNFLDWVDFLLSQMKWQGIYQVASFHPDYCFGGVLPDAAENLTNRSPYPILHILREDSLEKAIDSFPNVEDIPPRNIKKMNALSLDEKRTLFPYIFPSSG